MHVLYTTCINVRFGLQISCRFVSGTPEVGGLTTVQALEIVRGCRGLNVIGGDVVEV